QSDDPVRHRCAVVRDRHGTEASDGGRPPGPIRAEPVPRSGAAHAVGEVESRPQRAAIGGQAPGPLLIGACPPTERISTYLGRRPTHLLWVGCPVPACHYW